MKQKFLLKTMLLLSALVVGLGNVWGQSSIEINTTNSGVTGSYQDATFDVDGITFGFTQWMKSTNIQAKKSTTNSCYNVDAIPGTITSIVIVQTGTARAITMYGGTSQKPTNQITSPATAATMTFDFSDNSYNYFSLKTPGNACYFDKITIYYTISGGGTTSSDLALTGDPITLNFDLYNNKSAQEIAYTTSSTGAVSVVSNDYVTATVNTETKKISITPKKVTVSAQTITVNQAADATYAAGSATFTVNITDSTPKETFEKITSAADLATGDELIIVAEGYNVAAGTRSTNSYLASVPVVIDDSGTNNEIEVPIVGSDVNVFVICDDTNDTWTLYSKMDDEYIYESAVKTLASGNNDSWSISFNNDGNAVVSGTYPIRYNASSPRFTTYNGSGQNIQLYRKVVDRTHVTVVGTTGYTTYVTKGKVAFPAGVTAYIATNAADGSVTLQEVASAPANTAVIIEAAAGEYTLTAEASPANCSANLLYSSNGYIEGNGTNVYALGVGKVAPNDGKVGFYLVGDGAKVPAGKAYLEYTSGAVKEFLTFSFEDDADGLERVQDVQEVQGAIFNLAGQRLSKMQKGINIVNGKKVLK